MGRQVHTMQLLKGGRCGRDPLAASGEACAFKLREDPLCSVRGFNVKASGITVGFHTLVIHKTCGHGVWVLFGPVVCSDCWEKEKEDRQDKLAQLAKNEEQQKKEMRTRDEKRRRNEKKKKLKARRPERTRKKSIIHSTVLQ